MPWDSARLLQQLELGEDSRVEFKEVVFAANRVRAPRRDSIADELEPLAMGGSAVFTEGTGYLPNLTGRLNPILDNLDRMYLYTANVAIDGGKQQPVRFKLNQPLRLTDVNGIEWIVRFIEMIGNSALLEYERPDGGANRSD